MTTVAAFVAAAAVLYLARAACFILLLALLLAYLLEPTVTFVEKHSKLGRNNRALAIAQVYVIGTVAVIAIAYKLGPSLIAQLRNFSAAIPQLLKASSTGQRGGGAATFALSAQQLRTWLGYNQETIAGLLERAVSAARVFASVIWLFILPILSAYILLERPQILETLGKEVEEGRKGKRVARMLQRIDTMLAHFVRGQLALASLSFVFYSCSMLALKFPYPIALAALGGVLEFLPALGWIASAVIIVMTGFLMHAHWLAMACLLVFWRLVQDYVNSPRIMGKEIELRPLTVIVALMVGGEVGGIAGMYLAVPAAAVLRIARLEFFSNQSSTPGESDNRMHVKHSVAKAPQ